MKLVRKQLCADFTIKEYVVNKNIEIAVAYLNNNITTFAIYNKGHYLCECSLETKPTLPELKKEVLRICKPYFTV
jgi:hypothetical protein